MNLALLPASANHRNLKPVVFIVVLAFHCWLLFIVGQLSVMRVITPAPKQQSETVLWLDNQVTSTATVFQSATQTILDDQGVNASFSGVFAVPEVQIDQNIQKESLLSGKFQQILAAGQVAQAKQSMKDAIIAQWLIPAGFDQSYRAVLQLTLDAQGNIETLTVVDSSGNLRFDESIKQAARHSQPYHQVAGLSDELFREHFTKVLVAFVPEHITNGSR